MNKSNTVKLSEILTELKMHYTNEPKSIVEEKAHNWYCRRIFIRTVSMQEKRVYVFLRSPWKKSRDKLRFAKVFCLSGPIRVCLGLFEQL